MADIVDVYVLNGDLEPIGVVDNYTSLIWSNRYNTEGDCELYVEATTSALSLLKKGYFLARLDDEMVCRIEQIELDTDAEDGNYLVVTGYDAKKILSQRIIWNQLNVDGNVEDYVRNIVYSALVAPSLSARQITNASGQANFFLGEKAGFTQVTSEQVTYDIVSIKVQEICETYGWGYKVIVENGNFYFVLYEGVDRSDTVIFSPEFENIISSTYIEDSSSLANVALIGGEGEGSSRSRSVAGKAEGLDRFEIFVDADDISKTITWADLIELYPATSQGGQGYINNLTYCMKYIDIMIVDSAQLADLQTAYPDGQEITKDGNRYYRISNAVIADLESSEPEDNDDVILRDVVYSVYLLNRGYEKLAEYGATVSFDGTVEPDVTFKYKTDYFLGDIVTVENEFGISAEARIIEVVEVYDDNGYSVEPKFEYMED